MKRLALIKNGIIENVIIASDEFIKSSEIYLKQYDDILEIDDKPGSPGIFWIRNVLENPKIPDDSWIVNEYLGSLKER